MGINRIRLQNGAMGDPRVDARMQQTYQQNIADNQAQEAINQQNLNVGRERIRQRMRGMGNSGFQTPQAPGILSQVGNKIGEANQAVLNYAAIPTNSIMAGLGLPYGYSTQSMRDTAQQAVLNKAQEQGSPGTNDFRNQDIYVGYDDLGGTDAGTPIGEGQTSAQRALALTAGDFKARIDDQGNVVYDRDTLAHDFMQDDPMAQTKVDIGIPSAINPLDIVNRGGLLGQRVYTPLDKPFDFQTTPLDNKFSIAKNVEKLGEGVYDLLNPTTAAAAEPSAMPQGSPGQLNPTPTPDAGTIKLPQQGEPGGLITDGGNSYKINEDGMTASLFNQKPTMADVAGPATAPTMLSRSDFFDQADSWKEWTETSDKLQEEERKYYENLGNPGGSYNPDSQPEYLKNLRDKKRKLYDQTWNDYYEYETKKNKEFKEYETNLASGGRVGFQDGTDPNLTARQVAEQNPELHAMRQNFFGTSYLDDIDQGNTGTVQYYSGLGNPTSLNYTPPVVEETPAVDTIIPVVDGGGDGGGGGGISTGNETGNTDFEQNLLDQGIGVQAEPGAPISAPGEGMLTQQAIDDLANYPRNTEFDPNALEQDIADVATNTSQAEFDALAEGLSPDVDIDSMYPDQVPEEFETEGMTPMDVREQYGAQGQYGDYVNPADVEAGLATESMFDTPEQTKSIGDAFNSVKDLGAAGVDKLKDSLTALGGKLKPGFDNVIEIGGKTIDLTKSLLGGAISLATGIPGVGFVLNAIKEDPVDTYNQSLFSADDYLNSDMYKVDKDMTDQEYGEYKNRLGGYYGDLRAGNLEGQDPFGKNITSVFGDYEAMAQDIVNKVSSIPVDERSQFEKDQLDFYGDVVKDTPAPQEDIGATDTMASINMQEAKDITDGLSDEITDGSDLRGNPYGGGQTGVQSGMNTPTNNFAGQGTGGDGPAGGASNAAANEAAAAANEAAASNREAARTGQYDSGGGGGGGGGGGKIVCTMMNDSYGFGSFRNKIWLKHSRDMKPEYQKGYHKIFLPLVKLSKTNKVLKKVLEHIAVHRTIDIRQESRGKTHLLGRVYRKILEPICYIVGKYAK